MKTKVVKKFEYYGLGFPVTLSNFPVKKYWGEEMPDLNYNTLQHVVIETLARKLVPLTGNEVRFIRQYFSMNYTEFAKRFGQSRQAIAKWESKGDDFASITPSTELHIRLAIFDLLKANNTNFRKLYIQLNANEELWKKKHAMKPTPISITPIDIKF